MVTNGFYRRDQKKLKCHSCGNCMMRLTLDVAIQILVKRDENNYFPRKCNLGYTTGNKLTTGLVSSLSAYLCEDNFSTEWVIYGDDYEYAIRKNVEERPFQDTFSTFT
jgi:hypothetical protein